ncbi:MAG: BlaI/MecI/CopY family transcriptional regulator [Defluviitaleaceae bacterium]|nr:BlaI/MecI/CopY family transcriptional regulator [Defluviitaleaceae bacterium]
MLKLYDAELKIMQTLWREGEASAKRIAEILGEEVGWKKTTTYTMLKRCVDKGAVERREPGFVCRPIISAEDVREYETDELINKMYGGAADVLVASLLDGKKLSDAEISRLRQMILHYE